MKAGGIQILNVDGHSTIDAVGGLWCVNLGYSVDPIKEAIREQLDVMPYYNTFRGMTNDKAIELSYMLQEWFAPDGLTRSFFTSGGSDSVETTLRMARNIIKSVGADRINSLV